MFLPKTDNQKWVPTASRSWHLHIAEITKLADERSASACQSCQRMQRHPNSDGICHCLRPKRILVKQLDLRLAGLPRWCHVFCRFGDSQ